MRRPSLRSSRRWPIRRGCTTSGWAARTSFAPDREAARKVAGCRPQVVAGARANREFLGRVVRYLAGTRGVSQFLDIGTGLPAPGNTHEQAQALNPAARVVYADNDPAVLAHARA